MKKMVLAMAAAAMAAAGAAFGATINIGTLEELQLFMQNAHNPPYYAGDTVKLTADIDCGGGQFTSGYSPAGTVFKGTFDGQNHKIFNFSNKGNSPGTGNEGKYGVAMFDIARDGAVIKNLTLEGNFDDGAASPDYAAAFAAYAIGNTNGTLGLTLENCHFKGRVSNYRSSAAFVGYAVHGTGAPDGRVLYMTNCTANGTVLSDYSYVVGGLVANGEAVEAADCSFEGAATGRWTLGGLIGRAVDCSFERCSFEGELGSESDVPRGSNGGCGGLVGFASNSVFRACSSDADIAWNINTDPYDPDGRIDSYNFTADGGAAGVTCGSSAFYDCTAAGTLLAKHGYGGGFVGWTAGSEIFSNCVTEVTLQPDARYSNTHGHGGFASTVASAGALFVDCTTRSQGNNIVGGFFNNQHPRKGFTVGSNTFRRCHVENVPAESAGFCSGAWNCTFEGCTVRGGTGDAGFVYSAGRQPDNQWNSNYSYEQTSTYTDCSVLGTRAPFGFVEWSNYSEKDGHTNIFRRCRAGCVYGKSNSSGAQSSGFGSTLNKGTIIEDCAAYGIADMGHLDGGFADSISVGATVRRCVGAVYPRNVDVTGAGFADFICYGTTVEDCYAVYAPYASAVNQSGDNGWRYGAQGGFVRRTTIGHNADDLPIARCFALWPLSKPNSGAEWISGAFCGVTPESTSTNYFEDCYRPEESAIGSCRNADAEGVEALSLAEFATATAATMPNYDFVNTWHAPNGAASSPYLDASVDENGDFWFLAAVIGAEGRILVNGEAPAEAYPAGSRLKVKAVADNPDLPFAGWVGEGFENPAAQETWYTVKNVSAIAAKFCTPIYTVNDWTNKMSAYSTENFALMADLDFTEMMKETAWDRIRVGNFQGKFFGQGHTIRGICWTNVSERNCGALFEEMSAGAEIRDLTVESAFIPAASNVLGNAAGLVGTVGSGALVSNCHAVVDFRGTHHARVDADGRGYCKFYGLVANASGTDIRIVDCSVEGNIVGSAEACGFIGSADLTGGEIARCSAMGTFCATNSRGDPHGRASGFAGEITLRNGATVRECFAAGVVEGAYYGSGFAHKISFTDDQSIVRDCYSTAEVATREGGGINDYGNAAGFAYRLANQNYEDSATLANCWFGGTARALSEYGHSYGFAWILDGDVELRNCAFVQSGTAGEEMEGTAGVTAIAKGSRLSTGSWGGYDIGGAWKMENGKTTPYFAWSLKDGGFRVFALDETEGTSISHPEVAEAGTQAAVAGDTELALAVDTWLGAAGYADEHAPETTFLADNHRTLRCSWKEAAAPVSNVTQKVTFNGNGGTPATQKKTYQQNGKYDPLPGDPALADRVFGGWFTLPEGGTPITTNSTVTAVSNRTLYAHWKAYQNVTFDPNGGTCEPTDGRYEVGLAYGTLATAVREGYTLAGWFDAAEGGTQVTPAMTVAEPGAKTLHARWTANQYSVGLFRISGTGGTTNVMATFDSPMPAIKPPTGYTGHTFEGYWTERAGAGTKYYNGDGTSARDWDIAAATNLYGYWPGNRYTATFDKQGGTGGSSNAAVTYDQIVPAVTIPARTGYDFQGYFTEPNGKGTQYWRYNGQGDAYWMLTEDRTLYASWYAKFYSVSFDKQGGSGGWSNIGVSYGEMLPFMGELPTKDGCSFGGYWSEPNGGGVQYYAADGEPLRSWTTDGNGRLYAKWTPSSTPLTVWRFYSKTAKGHFYTISPAQKLQLISTSPSWKFEKGVFRAFTNAAAGTVPLYRFYSSSAKGHFFTVKESEKAKLMPTNSGWKYEGVAYYVYPTEMAGSVPVYRFWSSGVRHHFFTANAAEKEALCATNSGWKYEGIAFWALPPDPATAATAVEQTVWRFYSATTKGHFYTISDDEALKLIANSGWKFENGVFRAYPKAVTGTVPLYRFYSSSAKGHFFTIKESEKAKLMPTNSGWKYEGIAYYVYPGEVAGSVPVFRFWNASVRHHFYTASTAQRDSLIAGNSGWKYEGIAFWALPLDDTPAAAANAAAPKANAAPRAVRKATTASVEAGAEGVGGTSGVGGTAASIRAAVTTSDGSDGSAVADGDEGTAWTVDATDGAWVVLSFAAAREVAEVEVVGENLPEGMRVLLSEDAEEWWEGEGGAARYVWVAFPAGTGPVTVREVLVGDSGAR